MHKQLRALWTIAALTALSSLVYAQTSPYIFVGPGRIDTFASSATSGLTTTVGFNAVLYQSRPTTPLVYFSESHSEQTGPNSYISQANVYYIDLSVGQAQRLAGTAPNHTTGNTADCAPGTPAVCPGDGLPAEAALLHEPSGLAIDLNFNFYIADTRQNVIRRIDPNGIMTTYAGTGVAGAGADGPVTTSALSSPTGLLYSPGSNLLYVVDTGNNRVRSINLSNGTITTVAAGLNQPRGIAIAPNSGNIFIADTGNQVIRELSGGNLSVVAGQVGMAGNTGDGQQATSATLSNPSSVAVDYAGGLYITSSNNNPNQQAFSVIRKVSGDPTHTISTIVGSPTAVGYSGDGGPAQTALLNGPTFMTLVVNELYLIDQGSKVIRTILVDATSLTIPANTNSSPYPLTIYNVGGNPLNLSSLSFSPSGTFTAGSNSTCVQGTPVNGGASCTIYVNFTAGGSTSGTLTIISDSIESPTINISLAKSNGLYFVPVTPCRVIDTRSSDPNFGGGAFTAKTSRNYAIRNTTLPGGCAAGFIPAATDVQAYSLNVTAMPSSTLSYLTVYPSGINPPTVSNLNSNDGRTKANAAIVPAETADTNRSISIYASDATDVVVDINGYYVPEANAGSLAYYSLPPCRAVDTRSGSGLLGQGAFIQGGNQQGSNYALTNVCNLPSTAQAYALNYTAIPRNGKITYLTTWPTGSAQPLASTLNAPTGVVTANAAIVPVNANTNGSVSVYSTDDADLIIDVSGYYAPPSTGGLALYNLTPCRALDTRASFYPLFSDGAHTISSASCSVPATAQSYVLNTTVLPSGSLSYLTAWSPFSGEPVQSVLNAYDGAITSNLAVVPTDGGNIETHASSPTALILDLFAYFAP